MRWPHGPEMALVEGGDFGLGQALDVRHDAGIQDPERQIRVATSGPSSTSC